MKLTVRIQKKFAKKNYLHRSKNQNEHQSFTLEADFNNNDGCLGILGASGSGKSLTLKCIAGIETPDEGYISLGERVLFDSAAKINIKPQQRAVGYLFQNYALFPSMTVLQNITLALNEQNRRNKRQSRLLKTEIDGKACLFLEKLGLSGFENRYPATLSGGEQQRCALARMLILKPQAMLLDEPFSALDSTLREQMQILMQDILQEAREQSTAIMVTHSRDEAYRLCPNLAVMEHGKIISSGITADIFASPLNITAAQLTGCKNISAVRKTGENKYFAVDWGIELQTASKCGGTSDSFMPSYIGIRAHDLIPCTSDTPAINCVLLKDPKESRDPFENTIIFTSPAGKELWWKYSKYMIKTLPKSIFLPPESLMLMN
ncbi:MAG: sulfate/molybdate ABC transporter ATP-binding protein [Termitinemataceae bacterium]|nr:MAG: sulfate/molybdate ABC transporter ATP-binding protein [Termitinemataceae bacterium]